MDWEELAFQGVPNRRFTTVVRRFARFPKMPHLDQKRHEYDVRTDDKKGAPLVCTGERALVCLNMNQSVG